jgi:hypothetical protein
LQTENIPKNLEIDEELETMRETKKLVKEVKALAMKQKDEINWIGELMVEIGDIFSDITENFQQTDNSILTKMPTNSVRTDFMKATLSVIDNVPKKTQHSIVDLTTLLPFQVEPELLLNILTKSFKRTSLHKPEGIKNSFFDKNIII